MSRRQIYVIYKMEHPYPPFPRLTVVQVLLLCNFSQSRWPGGDCRPAEPLPLSLLAGLHGCSDPLGLKLLLRDAGWDPGALMLVHDSSLFVCEPPCWTGQAHTHRWLSSLQVQPCKWLCPPHSKPCTLHLWPALRQTLARSSTSRQPVVPVQPQAWLRRTSAFCYLGQVVHICNLFLFSCLQLYSISFQLAGSPFHIAPGSPHCS